MTQRRDFFNQVLEPNDRVLVAENDWSGFRIAEVVRFTAKAIVITRKGSSTKALYVKSAQVIKMTEEMEMLNTVRLLVK